MQDHITAPMPVTPPAEPGTPPGKTEAKNDGLAVTALVSGFLFWPLGLLFGHLSNRAAKRAGRKRSILSIVGLVASYLWALVVAGLIIGLAASSSATTAIAAAPAPPASSAPAAPAAPADTTPPAATATNPAPSAPASSSPAAKAPAKPAKPAKPAVTVSQQQALDSAKSYLDMGGFSRAGLIDQLTSHYGEQFTLAQATYAANQVGL